LPALDRQAYIELLLDHYESPRNRGRIDDADIVVSGSNPGCGDVVTLYIKSPSREVVESVRFEGEGCTISMAGASIISELAEGKPRQQIEDMTQDEIVDLMGREVVMSRLPCAIVGLGTLQAGLRELRAPSGSAPRRRDWR
jgi:nitrogen fixation NifU-like protein